MNKSIIKDIFYGLRGNIDTVNMPQSKKNSAFCEAYDELESKLNPQLLKLHQKIVNALEDNWSKEADYYFVEGFKLGLLIGIECMEKQ